jgi:hypothetical protein
VQSQRQETGAHGKQRWSSGGQRTSRNFTNFFTWPTEGKLGIIKFGDKYYQIKKVVMGVK